MLLEWEDEGIIDRDTVILACCNYLSEADVHEMMHMNEFLELEDELEDED